MYFRLILEAGGGSGISLKIGKMDNQHYADNGHASMVICLVTGFIAWIDTQSLSGFLKDISVVVSIAAGIMAIRYYYHATKKQK